ncbi:MAG: FeoA family protein [Desulfobulbaceae bacterium]|nr:FeoA family protein [Desulfobulbaceae bacterium]
MTKNPPDIICPCICDPENGSGSVKNTRTANCTPLTLTCGCEKMKICRISGDRKMCARMAQLGFLPGSEIELVCPGKNRQCMVRIKGSTITLDELQAKHIFVTPA